MLLDARVLAASEAGYRLAGFRRGALPPDSVSIGPVQPCGWSCPLLSGSTAVRPVANLPLFAFFGLGMGHPGKNTKPERNKSKAHINPSDGPLLRPPPPRGDRS
jgi:hypothetical protein